MPAILLLLLLCVISASAVPIKVACVGDSITEGTGLSSPSTESYPARLQRLLGTNYTVRNFGVSGRTLLKRGDFPYWNESLYTQSRNFAPDIVIIQLGTNDSKPQNWRYDTNYIPDYKDLINVYATLASAPRIFLCTPCPVLPPGAYDISPGIVETNIAPKVRGLAAELGLPLIDLHVRFTNRVSWFPDKVHPNSKGMAAMAAIMFEAVAGGLPDEPPPPLTFQRVSATRTILKWPARWGALIPQTTTQLRGATIPWTVAETAIPRSDGEFIRQTNNYTTSPTRFFELIRP